MMMKKWMLCASRNLVNSSTKTTHLHNHQLINKIVMPSTFCLRGIHHNTNDPLARTKPGPMGQTTTPNNIDAPFLQTDELKNQGSPFNDDTAVPLHAENEKSRTEEVTDYVTDKAKRGTKGAADFVTDKAKRGTRGVAETAFNVGEAMAEGMEKSWGGIKETTQKVKDAVLGDDNKNDDGKDGNERSGEGDYGKVDKHVEDLRRKARGYDRS